MTAIDTMAEAKVFKTGPFWNRKRSMSLFVNGEDTGLHWGITRKQEKTLPQELVENAAEILEHYGLMEEVFNRVAKAQGATDIAPALLDAEVQVKELVTPDGATLSANGSRPFTRHAMPRKGQRVALTVGIGHFPKGLVGTVTRVDEWLETVAEENQYPVRVALTHGPDTVELPLHLHEIEIEVVR